ncbi:MAG TPA: hypothetical protein VLE97_06510 [Gaiellaceae bacterium]|nr:hypothetical protein [Gaiellaceae bacterium]
MRDGDRRKLIILAEARASTTAATAVIQRLRVNLDLLKGERALPETDPRRAACQVARELLDRLINLQQWIDGQISEVPS